jgi:hypothetical protein
MQMAIAYDPNGCPRLRQEDFNEARDGTGDLWNEVMEYLRRRPDLGPLSKWHIKVETR